MAGGGRRGGSSPPAPPPRPPPPARGGRAPPSPPAPGGLRANAPFPPGRWLSAHNGYAPPGVVRPLLPDDAPHPESPCASAILAASLWSLLERGAALADALGAVTTRVGAAVPDARLNLLASDGA